MNPSAVYYEPEALGFPLGRELEKKFPAAPWIPIQSHNRIDELIQKPNSEFRNMKSFLIIGVRKTHKYVENHKISDFLVPYTSSGCSAMCLYCYLVCNYNKCSYLRLFVNREQMLDRLIKASHKSERPCTYEIGSNSDLLLENTITENLPWTIERFAEKGRGALTFPTKFSMVEPLLGLRHEGKTIFRMSVNPQDIIRTVEIGTSPLQKRIAATNEMARAGYPVGLLIAPVIFLPDWREQYRGLLDTLEQELTPRVKESMTLEVIFMTYSAIHRMINAEAFPDGVELFDKELMTGRGRGKYWYKEAVRKEGEAFFKEELGRRFPKAKLVYIV